MESTMIEVQKVSPRNSSPVVMGGHEWAATLQQREDRVLLPNVRRNDRNMWNSFYYPESSSPSDIQNHKSMKIADAITQPVPPNINDLQPKREVTSMKTARKGKHKVNKGAMQTGKNVGNYSQKLYRSDVLNSLKRLSLIEPFLLGKAEKRAWLEVTNNFDNRSAIRKGPGLQKSKSIEIDRENAGNHLIHRGNDDSYSEHVEQNQLKGGDLLNELLNVTQGRYKRARNELLSQSSEPARIHSDGIIREDYINTEEYETNKQKLDSGDWSCNDRKTSSRRKRAGSQTLPPTATVVDMSTGGVIESYEEEEESGPISMSDAIAQYQRAPLPFPQRLVAVALPSIPRDTW